MNESPLFSSEADAVCATGEIFRHYKGGIYRLVQRDVRHSETGEIGVIYEHLWPGTHGYWFRPQEMFFGVLADGTQRFERITTN